MVPQVVDDILREFLWKSSCRGLNRLHFLRELRPDVLIEGESQPGEKRGFLGIDLCASSVNLILQDAKEVLGLPPYCTECVADGR